MKFTVEERKTIRQWLNKDPNCPESTDVKPLTLKREDGTEFRILRTTTYLGPDNKWKVRIGYEEETGYPVGTSQPIPGNIDHLNKKAPGKPDFKLVPKLPTTKKTQPKSHTFMDDLVATKAIWATYDKTWDGLKKAKKKKKTVIFQVLGPEVQMYAKHNQVGYIYNVGHVMSQAQYKLTFPKGANIMGPYKWQWCVGNYTYKLKAK